MPANETAIHQRPKRQRLMQSLSTVLSSTINKIITTKIVINFPYTKKCKLIKTKNQRYNFLYKNKRTKSMIYMPLVGTFTLL